VDDNSSSNSIEDEDEDKQARVQAATILGASESATAAAATTSDDCCEVCLVAPRECSVTLHVDSRYKVTDPKSYKILAFCSQISDFRPMTQSNPIKAKLSYPLPTQSNLTCGSTQPTLLLIMNCVQRGNCQVFVVVSDIPAQSEVAVV